MIEFAKTKDVPKILKLWQEAFGDSKEDVEKFLSPFLKYLLVYHMNNEVAAMLALLPVTLNNKCGRYVYAVATLKKFRSQGISTKLLDFAKDYIKVNNEDFLILVPANMSLFDFYEKRGFRTVSYIERKEYKYENSFQKTFDIQQITAAEYSGLRKIYIQSNDIVCWSADILDEISKLYNGAFYKIRGLDAAFFGFPSDDGFIIKELCCDKNVIDDAIDAVFTKCKFLKISATYKGNTPFAMIYPHINRDIYFNIALD